MLQAARTNTIFLKDSSQYSFYIYENQIPLDTSLIHVQYTAGDIIFSSGSTGIPKGVSIGDASIVNLMYSLELILKEYNIERIALNADYAFDAFIQQVIQLLLGKSIYILTKEERFDIEKLTVALNKYKIQQIDCTPSQLKLYFQEKLFERVPSLKVILVGGEAINEDLLSYIKATTPLIKFINVYGPCEATVDVTYKLINSETASNCIGTPILNTSIYILGEDHRPLKIDEIGEIVIQGRGVGHGYLNKTENKYGFCNIDIGGGIQPTYFTGDLGYINETGELFIKGRLDSQIKRNGVRIELAEIELVSKKIENIEDGICYVLTKNKIVLFVKTQSEITPEQIKILLQEYLADYMMPDEVIVVKRFLINTSGKVDLKTMYLEAHNNTTLANAHKEQLSPHEIVIATIWAKCLGINIHSINRTSNFFSIGGNSLLAFKALKEMRANFNKNVSISHLLNRSALSEIAEKVSCKVSLLNEKDNQNIFSINKVINGTQKLIMFHPIGGGVSCYRNLADYLEENNIEAIAIQDSFDSQSNAFNCIFDYGNYLADLIICQNKITPYLLGWSFGGILAYVVSLALQKKSIKVGGLILIDTFFNEQTKNNYDDSFGLQAVVNHLLIENNQKIINIDQIPKQANYLFDEENQLNKVYNFIKDKVEKFPIEIKDFRRIVQIANHHRKLVGTINATNLDKLDARINLIYASESNNKLGNNLFEWQNFSTHDITEYTVEADHYSIIKKPEVFSLILSLLNGD
jgi:thioesterase domain-containing protein